MLSAPLDNVVVLLFSASCSCIGVAPPVGNGGGGGALCATIPAAPLNLRFSTSVCFAPKAAYSFKKV
jgi:hypothetical protein